MITIAVARTWIGAITRCLFAVMLITFASHPAFAFTVQTLYYPISLFSYEFTFTGDANHEDITTRAILGKTISGTNSGQPMQISLSNGNVLTFHITGAATIYRANANADSRFMDVPLVHFDAESINQGNNRLRNMRKAIADHAVLGDSLAAQRLLGEALHTVQDFYAHSTWVENLNNIPADLGGTMTFSSGTNPSCDFTKVIIPSPLTSGFFEESQILIGNDYYFTNFSAKWPVGKCIHGTNRATNADFNGKGINKDNDKRLLFREARDFAVVATVKYINEVISEIKTRDGSDGAICGLLGQEDAPECVTGFWQGSYLLQTCTTKDSALAGVNACAWAINGYAGAAASANMLVRLGNGESNNIRWEHLAGGSVSLCQAQTTALFSLPVNSSFQRTLDMTGILVGYQNGKQSSTITFTVTKRTATEISGTFKTDFIYPTAITPGAFPTASGSGTGTWNLHPRPLSFAKCTYPPNVQWCAQNGRGYSSEGADTQQGGIGYTGTCDWRPAFQVGRPGEWTVY